jgi:SAM-dependent methyltransferase
VRRLVYSAWYLFKPPWDTGIPAPELVRAIAQRPAGRALDLGCGTGTNVRYLAEHGWQAAGLDFAPDAVARARRKCAGLPVTLLVADVTRLASLALPGPFDLALDMGCFHALDETGRRAYAAGLAHWLRPGGIFLLYAWLGDGGRSGPTRATVVAALENFRLTHFELGQGRPSAWYYFERPSR